MKDLMLLVTILAWGGGVILIPIYLFALQSVNKYLECMHHSLWVDLGRPHILLNNSMVNSVRVIRFLIERQFLDVNDEVLTRKAQFALLMFILCSFLMLVMFVSLVI